MSQTPDVTPDTPMPPASPPDGARPSLRREFSALAAVLLLLVLFYVLSRSNFVLFHVTAELFSIAVALAAFALAWNGRNLAGDDALLVLGTGLAAAALVDLLHTLGARGVALLGGEPVNTGLKYWMLARFLQTVTLLGFPFAVGRRFPLPLVAGGFALLTGLPIAAFVAWPDAVLFWRPGIGLTDLKIGGEALLITLLVLAILNVRRMRHHLDDRLASLLTASIAVTMASEFAFTQYLGWDDGATVVGHLLKVAAFWLLYRAIVYEGLTRPLEVLGGQLRASEARYRQIFERSLAPKLVIDPVSGALLDANEAACAFYGEPRARLLSRRIQDINVLSEAEITAAMQRAVASRERFFRFRHRLPGSGEVRNVEVYSGPVDEGGRTLLQSIVIDVTDRIRAEEDRRRLLEQSHEARRLEALGSLAGGLAHEFNNILAAIIGSADLAQDAEAAERRRCLDDILSASARARDLVRQILTFARQNEDERRPLDAAFEVQEALALLRPSVPGGVTLASDLGPSLPGTVDAVPGQIQQVLMNLITNAFQALEGRGGTVTVTLRSVTMAPDQVPPHRALHPGPHALLVVADDGPGISVADRPHIFEPFFTTRAPGKGVGLGLPVVHGIASALGGAVLCLDPPGPGASFAVYLPLTDASGTATADGTAPSTRVDGSPLVAPPASVTAAASAAASVAASAAATAATASAASLPRGTETVLLVDDEVMVGNIVARILGRLGYRVVVHQDPAAALEEIRATPHLADILVTDHTMPVMTGLDLAREARRIHPGLPVILLSGYTDVATPAALTAAGVAHLLPKPLDRAALARAVRSSLDDR